MTTENYSTIIDESSVYDYTKQVLKNNGLLNTSDKRRMKTSYSIDKDINLKLKFIALKDNTSISNLVEKSLYGLIADWEKKNGAIPNL